MLLGGAVRRVIAGLRGESLALRSRELRDEYEDDENRV